MKNTLFKDAFRKNNMRKVQLQRVRDAIQDELTDLQRHTIIAYYFHMYTIPEIAAQRGVNKSTVSRTLRRAEEKLRKYLKY